jgi:hypothetical protein
MGPGTQIEARVARADPPRTLSDKVAQAHDIRYAAAETVQDIRKADRKMVNTLKRIRKQKGDSSFNTLQGMKLIQAKMKLEDAGVMNKGSFGNLDKPNRDPPSARLTNKLDELEQEGFGSIESLKKKMMKFAS